MKSKDLKPLKVSLHGMDERMQKMMANYLKLPCKGVAVVVDDIDAHAEIVDLDLTLTKTLLDDRLSNQPAKPIIALSLHEISNSGVIYVKKPIQVPDVLAALRLTQDVILGKTVLEKTTISKPNKVKPTSADHPVKPKSTLKTTTKKPESSATKKSAFVDTSLESSKDVSDFITQAIHKSEATKRANVNESTLEETLKEKIIVENKPTTEEKPEQLNAENSNQDEGSSDKTTSNIVHIDTELSTTEGASTDANNKINPASIPAFLKQEEITFKSSSVKKQKESGKAKKNIPSPDKNITQKQTQSTEKKQDTQKESIKVVQETKTSAVPDKDSASSHDESVLSRLFNALWQRKGLITGLTCLISLLFGIYIFQLTPLYEAKARIFIGKGTTENYQDILDKTIAQNRINEIASRLLVGRVIKILELNTIPEFIEASITADAYEETDSALRQARKASEQLSKITDYFLQNLTVSQFKNSPIIKIEYKAEDPELAFKIVNQLVEEYLALQHDKNQEKAIEIDDWETNKLPAAKNKLKQSQDALALYVEMNKWSQFEQQFAEDMGVNSEIRALEKKVKADLALFEILLKRFDNLKKEYDGIEVKLISNAELPSDPSYPNRQRLLLITLLSAVVISIIIALIVSAMNFSGKKIIGEPI